LWLASGELGGSPFCGLPDELLQQQHVKGLPEQAVTLFHQRMCLLLGQGGTGQRDSRFQDDTLGVGDGFSSIGRPGAAPDNLCPVNGILGRWRIITLLL
jgi:hypothetical protein